MRAYVFPGQGTQKKGMGMRLFERFRGLIGQADEVLGYSIERLCLDDPEGLLSKTEYAQPAIYVVNALCLRELEQGSPRPEYLAGHSVGECNALLAAGAFDFRAGLSLVKRRAELMAKADGGGMAAVVGLSEQELDDALRAYGAVDVTIANHNAPRQFVLSGKKTELGRLKPILEAIDGVKAFIPLRTSGAFHSPHMEAASREFRAFLEGFDFAELTIPVIANVTGRPYPKGAVRDLLAEQISKPVRWTDSVHYLRRAGVSSFIEVGEGKVLTVLVDKIVAEAPPPPAPGEPPGLEDPHAGEARREERSAHRDADAAERAARDPEGPRVGAPLLTKIAEHWAARPDKTLLIFHDDDSIERITGAELARRVDTLGPALASVMGPQEKAILLFPQGSNYVCTLLACWHANVVAIPTPVTSSAQFEQKAEVLEAILRSSGASHVLCDEALRPEASRLAERHGLGLVDVSRVLGGAGSPGPVRSAHESDLALVLYTSGSTSQPKGVMLDHATIFRTAAAEQWRVSEESCVATWLPKFHAFGITFGTLTPLVRGALSVTSSPESFIRDPASWFELIDRYKATHTGAPNFAFDYCWRSIDERASEGLSLASLQSLICGGDIINKQHYERFAQRFASLGLRPDVLTPNFGMSEAGPITLKAMGTPFKHLSLNKRALEARRVAPAAPGEDARVVMSCGETDDVTRVIVVDSERCEPCPPDAIGELWVKTPRQAQGYLNDEAATRSTFHGVLATTGEGGFLRTGDLGFVVGRDVYIVGREKDVIVVNGKKYDSADVELTLSAALDSYPAASDRASGARLPCAAFSYEDDDREKVIVVQEVNGAAPEQTYSDLASGIVGIVSRKLQLEVSDVVLAAKGAIPLTGSKKVRRKACKEQFLSGSLPYLWHLSRKRPSPGRAAAESPGPDDLVDVIKRDVLLPVVGEAASELDARRPFSQLGLDSIQYIRLARKVEAVFGVTFTPDMFYAHATCAALAEHLAARGGALPNHERPERWRAYRDERVAAILRECARGAVTVERAAKLIRERI
ncbi:ACP S-malonyltransferase [Sorangium sp. So ce1000]|uniref:ACP S-malonyltransferase n=1 Tax=Sorangium sp. So ce1000 TaxID=3133325 RepID=UPI003F606881